MVIFLIQLRRTYRALALKLTPREKTELEVIHSSTDENRRFVAVKLNTQRHAL